MLKKYHFPVMEECILIRRHLILLFIKTYNYLFSIIWGLTIFSILIIYNEYFNVNELLKIILFIVWFLMIHIWFFAFLSQYIKYKWNMIIIINDQIILLKYWLLLEDDIEIIDAYRIMKFDWFVHWLLPNIIWYWQLVIEQQKEQPRTLSYIPLPYKVLWILKEQRAHIQRTKDNKKIIKTN